jgi:hypothetical protein
MTRRFWSEKEVNFLKENYPDKGQVYCSKSLNRTERAVRDKARKLGISSNNSRLAKSESLKSGEYSKTLLNTNYTSLEPYVTGKTKILHRHNICGYEWKVTPDDIKVLKGCPQCSLNRDLSGRTYLYFIYFESLNLYKVGITNSWSNRKYEFGETPDLLELEEFATREDALKQENILLDKLSMYMYDSGLLKNGNTETFIWPN